MPAERPWDHRGLLPAVQQQPEEPRGLQVLPRLEGMETKDLSPIDAPLGEGPPEGGALPCGVGEARGEDRATLGDREPLRDPKLRRPEERSERSIRLREGTQGTFTLGVRWGRSTEGTLQAKGAPWSRRAGVHGPGETHGTGSVLALHLHQEEVEGLLKQRRHRRVVGPRRFQGLDQLLGPGGVLSHDRILRGGGEPDEADPQGTGRPAGPQPATRERPPSAWRSKTAQAHRTAP